MEKFNLKAAVAELAPMKALQPTEVGRRILQDYPAEVQPQLAKALDYVPGMTAHGRGWRLYNPRDTIVVGTAVIIEQKNTILMLKRWNADNAWEPPGGGLRANETVTQCALREGMEETGLQLVLSKLIGVYSGNVVIDYPDGERRKCVVNLFAAQTVGGTLDYSNEATDARWVKRNDVLDMPMLPLHRELMQMALMPRRQWPVMM